MPKKATKAWSVGYSQALLSQLIVQHPKMCRPYLQSAGYYGRLPTKRGDSCARTGTAMDFGAACAKGCVFRGSFAFAFESRQKSIEILAQLHARPAPQRSWPPPERPRSTRDGRERPGLKMGEFGSFSACAYSGFPHTIRPGGCFFLHSPCRQARAHSYLKA